MTNGRGKKGENEDSVSGGGEVMKKKREETKKLLSRPIWCLWATEGRNPGGEKSDHNDTRGIKHVLKIQV